MFSDRYYDKGVVDTTASVGFIDTARSIVASELGPRRRKSAKQPSPQIVSIIVFLYLVRGARSPRQFVSVPIEKFRSVMGEEESDETL